MHGTNDSTRARSSKGRKKNIDRSGSERSCAEGKNSPGSARSRVEPSGNCSVGYRPSRSIWSTEDDRGPRRIDRALRIGKSSAVRVRTAAISSPRKSWPRAASAIESVVLPAPLPPMIRTPASPTPTAAAWKKSTSRCIRMAQFTAQLAMSGCQGLAASTRRRLPREIKIGRDSPASPIARHPGVSAFSST